MLHDHEREELAIARAKLADQIEQLNEPLYGRFAEIDTLGHIAERLRLDDSGQDVNAMGYQIEALGLVASMMLERWQEASDLIGPVQHRHSAVERLLRIDDGEMSPQEHTKRLNCMGRTLHEMDLENDWRQLQPEQIAEERKRQEANVRTARRALTRIQAIEVLHKPDDTRPAPYNAASKAFEGVPVRESVSDTA